MASTDDRKAWKPVCEFDRYQYRIHCRSHKKVLFGLQHRWTHPPLLHVRGWPPRARMHVCYIPACSKCWGGDLSMPSIVEVCSCVPHDNPWILYSFFMLNPSAKLLCVPYCLHVELTNGWLPRGTRIHVEPESSWNWFASIKDPKLHKLRSISPQVASPRVLGALDFSGIFRHDWYCRK